MIAMLLFAIPDPVLTPGVVDHSCTVRMMCTKGYTATVRDVPASIKRKVVQAYVGRHPSWPKCKPLGKAQCEIDHDVSLELCGSNDPANLWPQPYCELRHAGKTCFGAREKDVVENYFHRTICARKNDKPEVAAAMLDVAQRQIAADWVGVYKKIKGIK